MCAQISSGKRKRAGIGAPASLRQCPQGHICVRRGQLRWGNRNGKKWIHERRRSLGGRRVRGLLSRMLAECGHLVSQESAGLVRRMKASQHSSSRSQGQRALSTSMQPTRRTSSCSPHRLLRLTPSPPSPQDPFAGITEMQAMRADSLHFLALPELGRQPLDLVELADEGGADYLPRAAGDGVGPIHRKCGRIHSAATRFVALCEALGGVCWGTCAGGLCGDMRF